MKEEIIEKIASNIKDIDFNLYENLRSENGRDYFVVFYIKDCFRKNIELIYKEMRNIVIVMDNVNFLFDKKYQVFINTNSILDEDSNKYKVPNVFYTRVYLNNYKENIKKEYDFYYHMTINSGRNQHYLPANIQRDFFNSVGLNKSFYMYKEPFKSKEILRKIDNKLFKKTGCKDFFFSKVEHPLLDIKISRDYEIKEKKTRELIYSLMKKNYISKNSSEYNKILKNIILPLYLRSIAYYNIIEKSIENEINDFFKDNYFLKNTIENDMRHFIEEKKLEILKSNFEKTILINMEWLSRNMKSYKYITGYKNKDIRKSLLLTENVVFFMNDDKKITPFMKNDTNTIIYLVNSSTLICFNKNPLSLKDMINIFKEIKEVSLKFSENFIFSINNIDKDIKLRKNNRVCENILNEKEKGEIRNDLKYIAKIIKLEKIYRTNNLDYGAFSLLGETLGPILNFIFENNIENLNLGNKVKMFNEENKKNNQKEALELLHIKGLILSNINHGEKLLKQQAGNEKIVINKIKDHYIYDYLKYETYDEVTCEICINNFIYKVNKQKDDYILNLT